MRTSYHPNIRGFEFGPAGKLLQTLIDMKGRMGIAYERCIDYRREVHHAHDRLNLSFPRNACIVEIEAKLPLGKRNRFRIDSSKLLSIPKGQEHNHLGKSLVYDTMALYPGEEMLKVSSERLGLGKSEILEFLGQCQLVKRTVFLNELLERYFAERVLQSSATAQLRIALEDQILDEILRLFFGAKNVPARKLFEDERESITERALQFVEANLFAAISSRDIAAYCRTSVASLFRVFKKDVRKTPFGYIRERRLDEALHLLKGKQYTVGDVALLVGYEDLSAFSKAFKRQFKRNASEYLGQ